MPKVLYGPLAVLTLTLAGAPTAGAATELIDDQRCLALTMYWEAKNQGPKGMIAVGAVVLNRVRHERFPDRVCDVVFQGGETPPCQFSWWCDGKSDEPQEQKAWSLAQKLAGMMLRNPPDDPTDGALFFHNTSVKPAWRKELTRTARLGSHVFYR